ncbi:MAG: HAMP domain-containing sensor histidine kinase, partial [Cellulosilyticaceae bacterium]
MNDPDNIYKQISANSLMKDNYTEIDTRQLIVCGGGLQVIDTDFNIVYSAGKKQFEGISISPGDFTSFLLEAINNQDMITVAYNEHEEFWLIVSMPISVKMIFRLSINTQNPMDTSTLWVLGLFGLGYLLIILMSTLIYAKRTATLFINPLHKLCLAVEGFRAGDYDTRVAIEGSREFQKLEIAFNHMAQEIQAQIALKEKSEKNRKQLILDISHDLKNPLMSIVGYAELSLKEEQTNSYANIIYENSLRANELVQDLFELSRLESADFKLEYSTCDFIEYFREEMIRMLPVLEKEGLEVNIQIPDIEVILQIDPKRIRRVIDNLLYNVITYHGNKKEVDIILENRD